MTWTLLFTITYFGAGITSQTNVFLTLEECQKTGNLLSKNVYPDNPNYRTKALCYQSNRIDIQ